LANDTDGEGAGRFGRITDALSQDLITYCDQEAKLRVERPVDARRVECQRRFAQQLVDEDRSNLVEIGTGTGSDAMEFIKVGIHVSGIDQAER
jgi:hypothetical protein